MTDSSKKPATILERAAALPKNTAPASKTPPAMASASVLVDNHTHQGKPVARGATITDRPSIIQALRARHIVE